jgi:hypothetical protein
MGRTSTNHHTKFPCNGCGVDVLAIGDWYMATSEVWQKQLGLSWQDNLCFACLEKRLGRKLKPFTDVWPVSFAVGRARSLNAVHPEKLSARWHEIFGHQSPRRRGAK